MKMRTQDLTGKIFGFWTVLGFSHKDKNYHNYWLCKCVCGNQNKIYGMNLKKGITESCGCQKQMLRKKTCLEKYGVDHVFKHESVIKKYEETSFLHYGVKNPSSSPKVRAKVINTNMQKYGVPCVFQNEDIKYKIEFSFMSHFGVRHPMQNYDIALKQAKSTNTHCILRHWYSNEDIVCVGSYEKRVVEYLNINKVDYLWQVQTFTMLT